MYVDWVTKELENNEEKRKKKKKGQLNGDGLPKLLTGDEFYNQVVDHHKSIAEQDAARKARQKQRDERNELLVAWREEEAACQECNKALRNTYHEELQLWELERDQAKAENRRPHWAKPKCRKLERPAPKPVLGSADTEEVGENNDNGENEEDARSDDD
ncbi:hypothetical protein BKA82DRAFT_153935 [Pisolithus tinctorius]|uniref:Uncharacterized protein n=1 Tax=Pisolithus tinctorius Marx 270 TaxID=870435 RepID=A0A0C3JQY5_PISTI|nr:hypothetical protein BKA82DRAFT_153935 [Pisolithus tinctorius]KIN99886.1 hypothetical protein M404DRAFT_153935 [Pisolithus tinctorius Marx 270]